MAREERWLNVDAGSGRVLRVLIDYGASGRPLVFHGGTPGSAVWYQPMTDAARQAGLRLITYSRPGYDGSTPAPGRRIASVASDVETILNALEESEYVTLGWSGGGPHALACAALSRGRCQAAATIAGVAPYTADGLDWLGGMGAENVEEFSAALAGEHSLRPALVKFAEDLKNVQGADIAASLGGLVSEVDRKALTGEFAEMLAASFHGALSTGVEGWLEDDLAFVQDWGFQLSAIRVPVAVWQGGEDRMVPFAHGQWLADHIPTTQVHLYPEHGHLSLGVASLQRIVSDLAALPERAVAR